MNSFAASRFPAPIEVDRYLYQIEMIAKTYDVNVPGSSWGELGVLLDTLKEIADKIAFPAPPEVDRFLYCSN